MNVSVLFIWKSLETSLMEIISTNESRLAEARPWERNEGSFLSPPACVLLRVHNNPAGHVCSNRGRVNSKTTRLKEEKRTRAGENDGRRRLLRLRFLSSKEEQSDVLLSSGLVFACVLFLPDLLFTFFPSPSSHLQPRRRQRRYYCFCCSSC